MPDITMCLNVDCKMKDKCYRYKAIPDILQSYAKYEPNNGKCDNFVKNKNTKEIGEKKK